MEHIKPCKDCGDPFGVHYWACAFFKEPIPDRESSIAELVKLVEEFQLSFKEGESITLFEGVTRIKEAKEALLTFNLSRIREGE